MSGYHTDEDFQTMINSLRTNYLQLLLGAFNLNTNGRKSVLKHRALQLLRSRPEGFNHQAYLEKIMEVYDAQVQLQFTMYQAEPPYYPQQSMHISRGGLPRFMPQMERGMYANNIPGNNNQYNYHPAGPSNIFSGLTIPHVPSNQQVNAVESSQLQYDMNYANTITPSFHSLTDFRLKKLPFYEVLFDVIKPTILVGQETCSLPNPLGGMREVAFKINMSLEQVNSISLNRTKDEFINQLQIRICLLELSSTELTDFLPPALHIRINNNDCPLPQTRPGTDGRRMAQPINGTPLLKLSPMFSNTITVNWIRDAKTYVIAVYIVEKLSSSVLLKKLNDKGARSSDETREYIIKHLADVDPNVATTSQEKHRDSVTLDDSDGNPTDDKKGTFPPESSNKETENLRKDFFDLTLDDEEEPPKDK